MNVVKRNNVNILGQGDTPMLFAHGFGCDQNMWRFVAPAFEEDYRTVLFDHVGAGKSQLSAYDHEKYNSLQGYADDIIEIIEAMNLEDCVFVGHSVAATMGVLAAEKRPELFKSLVLVAPSPCYINKDDYVGGFSEAQTEELLESLDQNHLGWSQSMAPVIMGNPDREELSAELVNSFCNTDPDIAKHFARVTFMSDHRESLCKVGIPSLVLQCSNDAIAPRSVGDFMHQELPDSELVLLEATGHCPNLSAPEETIEAMKRFL